MFRLSAIAVCGGLLIAAPLSAQSECEHRRDLTATIPVSAGEAVRIEAGAGSLQVIGRAGLTEARIAGTACASSDSRLEDLRVEAERRGGEAYIETIIPSRTGFFSRRGYSRIDLVVEMPQNVRLRIRDGSGSMEVTEVLGGMEIEDGSGSIELLNVAGRIAIGDGSGEVVIRNSGGDVHLVDGSGSITIQNVAGSVQIDEDGSGSISVEQVTGNVLIREDQSGSIAVHAVGGDFVTERDGSGSIDHSGVSGLVRLP